MRESPVDASHETGTDARAERAPTSREDGCAIVRRATAADAIEIAALFQLEYRDSSHPFQTVDDVSAFLSDSRNFEIVAELDDRIVSSMAMAYCAWNDSYELGRAITHFDYRRHGLAGAVMQPVVDWVRTARLGQVFFGFPRARRIVDLCAALAPAMVVVGHDGGRNVADGTRETHLIVYAIPPHGMFEHVAPLGPVPFDRHRLEQRYYGPLDARPVPGSYPPTCFVGETSGTSAAFESFLIDYAPRSANRALEIVGDSARAGRPMNIGREIERLQRLLPEVEHMTATVLADKTAVIEALWDVGFQATAYLPAWFKLEGRRYDCVQLSKCAHRTTPATLGFDDLLIRLGQELTDPRAAGPRARS